MISCDNCGFGHKTFEEKKACKPWSQIVAEAKMRGEDPLGNPLQKVPRYEDENGKLWDYNVTTDKWDIIVEFWREDNELPA